MPRDKLDRYYTPPRLAAACLDTIRWDLVRARHIVEPSVGGGAFLQAARLVHPDAEYTAVDMDPAAPGLALPGVHAVHADWLDTVVPVGSVIIGNPPYSVAEEHVTHALRYGSVVAFLLRIGFLASRKRYAWWQANPPDEVHVISRRPSFTGGGTDSQEYAWYVWRAGSVGLQRLHWLSWQP